MDIVSLKLQLIEKVLEIPDLQLLKTIDKIIELYHEKNERPSPFSHNESPEKPGDEIADLQQEINDLFGNQ